MNYFLFIVIATSMFFVSCDEKKSGDIPPQTNTVNTILEIPDTIVSKSILYYNRNTSCWTLNDQLYSGYAVTYYQDKTLQEKFGILNGRKQNSSIVFYPDGEYKHLAHYHKGKLNGIKKSWSSDSSHILLSHLNYISGKAHGEQKKWYPTGELFKKINLNMGREEGMQQAFRKNGDLFANYEAREGRIFGLKKAALCFGIEDENIKYEK